MNLLFIWPRSLHLPVCDGESLLGRLGLLAILAPLRPATGALRAWLAVARIVRATLLCLRVRLELRPELFQVSAESVDARASAGVCQRNMGVCAGCGE